MVIRGLAVFVVTLSLAAPAWAGKNCDELKAEIEAKVKKNGVAKYSLEIVPTGTVKPEDKVVGRCEAGARQIVYKRG